MKLWLRMLVSIVFSLSIASAGSVKFVSIWKNPNAGPIDLSGVRIAAFVVTPDEEMRLAREETLAAEMRSRGTDCIAGYTVLPGELAKDRDKAKAFLKKAGITGAVMVRVLGQAEKTEYVPGTMWHAGPTYPTFWGYWDYSWAAVYTPGYLKTDTIVSLETLIYSIDRDMLLWAAQSETTNPKDVRKFVKDLVSAAGKEMRKSGLVKK
jgi:hypothetical protein